MKKNILLIEDDMAIIDIYRTALEAAGFTMEVITLGKDAVEKINKLESGEDKKPDLVLLDLILPDMNGMDILEEMRKKENLKDLPVFILTNYSSAKFEELGLKLKSEKYILKAECTPSKLVKIIKERLKS